MNAKLLRRVQKAILKHHDQFIMRDYFGYYLDAVNAHAEPAGGCGTAACLAGWALHLAKGRRTLEDTKRAYNNYQTAAERILSLSDYEGEILFVVHNWPLRYLKGWYAAKTSRGKVRVAARRIDYFIKHGE